MTCRQALEQVRTAIYNRITRTCSYITDDGILCIVNKAFSESKSKNGTEPRDTLIEAQKTINELRKKEFNFGCGKGCLGCKEYDTCDTRKTLDKIQNTIDNLSGAEIFCGCTRNLRQPWRHSNHGLFIHHMRMEKSAMNMIKKYFTLKPM